ncbi:toMV susceptible protein tm-2-like [Carex rostrata]
MVSEVWVQKVVRSLIDIKNTVFNDVSFNSLVKHLNSIRSSLYQIQPFLKNADMKYKLGDARAVNWVTDLVRVVIRIEKVIDKLSLGIQSRQEVINSAELKNIQKELKLIIWRMVDDEIGDLQGNEGQIVRRHICQEVDEIEVVGMEADKNNIVKLLRPEETLRRAVITIVGMGGLGKTTLANMVHRSVMAEFEYSIKLSITQHFNLIDLLRMMLRQLNCSVDANLHVEDLIRWLNVLLINKRYLIILDDVWHVELWDQLKNALPDANNGSRVLMTSRIMNVDELADYKMAPYKLGFLDDAKSQHLLHKMAFNYHEPIKNGPIEELSKKCKGLPLTLVLLGNNLLTKKKPYLTWERVLGALDWFSIRKDCMNVLAMSYEYMPDYLKACFRYLAYFPEDYEISAKRLIKMWVANECIPREGTTTMEKMGEDYLEELHTRCMIQVLSRSNMNGSIKCCRVHDLHREIAMYAVKEERSVALFFYKKSPSSYNFTRLNVLELVGITSYPTRLPKELDELIYLKYLGFINCNFSISSLLTFDRMKTLETLDVRGTRAELPDSFWTIGTLRHVLCNCGLNGPMSTADLKNLQTMQWVRPPTKTWDRELPLLENLSKLGVCWDDNLITMTNLLKTLPNLVSLGIKGSLNKNTSLPMDILYPKALPNYENLQSLHLQGKWSVTLDASLFPPNLIKLTLIDSQLEQNPMLELGKLQSLKKLCLRYRVMNYTGSIICVEGFSELQCLEVVGTKSHAFQDLTVAQGVMPKLTYLQLKTPIDFKFHLPLELQYVTVKYFGSTFVGKKQICEQFPLASFN